MKSSLLLLIALAVGFTLSFFGFGLMWIGIHPLLQGGAAFALFFLLCLILGKFAEDSFSLFLPVLIGALPIGAIFTQFRDKEDSHLVPIALVISWVLGAAAGTWLSKKWKK